MIKHLIKLHSLIVWRILEDLGIARLIFCLAVGIAALGYLFTLKNSWVGLVTVLCFVWTVILNLDSFRKDKKLILMIGASKSIYLIEYLLLSLPFIILWAISTCKFLVLIHVLFLLAIIWGNIKIRTLTFYFPVQKTIMPNSSFEWISGWRQNFLYFLIIYLLTFTVGNFKITVPIAILLFSLIASSFYKVCEPRPFLEIFLFAPRQFLINKLRQSVFIFCLFCLPLIIIFLLLKYEYWYWLMLVMVGSIIILMNAILAKYAFYEENSNLYVPNILVVSFTIIGFAIPYLIPLCLLSVIWLFKKAEKNLNQYLYAFD